MQVQLTARNFTQLAASRAACHGMDTEIFYLPEYENEARGTCAPCPIRFECLTYALGVPEDYGVWGGLSGEDRRRLRSGRHRTRCPGCRSVDTGTLRARMEFCRGCGLSWPV